jgi:hypothetical protein
MPPGGIPPHGLPPSAIPPIGYGPISPEDDYPVLKPGMSQREYEKSVKKWYECWFQYWSHLI